MHHWLWGMDDPNWRMYIRGLRGLKSAAVSLFLALQIPSTSATGLNLRRLLQPLSTYLLSRPERPSERLASEPSLSHCPCPLPVDACRGVHPSPLCNAELRQTHGRQCAVERGPVKNVPHIPRDPVTPRNVAHTDLSVIYFAKLDH